MAGFAAALILFIIGAWALLSMKTWYGGELLYRPLSWVQDHILYLCPLVILAGWVGILWYYLIRSTRYLDAVVAASSRLAEPDGGPVELPQELREVETELNLARERTLRSGIAAREAEQRKNDLVVYLAHDLKTPLTSVIGYLTLLRDENQISEELREKYLSISLDKAERLEDLINEFFEITRFNLSGITLEYTRVNLTRMLEQLIYEFRPMLTEKGLQCSLSAPEDLMLRCDVGKMQRVLDNLLRNAVHYSYAHTVIEVSARAHGGCLHIRFINQGDTIPPEKLSRIFEQFYRLDSARTSRSGGAGLGLAIAREIVELHHGTITASSEAERITFEVVLPLS